MPARGSASLNVRILFRGEPIDTTALPNHSFLAGFSGTWSKNMDIIKATINACKNPVSTVFGINTNLTARATNIAPNQETQIRIDTIDTTIVPVLFQIKFAFNPC